MLFDPDATEQKVAQGGAVFAREFGGFAAGNKSLDDISIRTASGDLHLLIKKGETLPVEKYVQIAADEGVGKIGNSLSLELYQGDSETRQLLEHLVLKNVIDKDSGKANISLTLLLEKARELQILLENLATREEISHIAKIQAAANK